MGKVKICDAGAMNLAAGIIKQAVSDFCNYVEEIVFYEDMESGMEKTIEKFAKRGFNLTKGEADHWRKVTIYELKLEMNNVERFFHSEWYRELCYMDADFMIKKMKETSIINMCDKVSVKLRRINEKNKSNNASLNTLKEFERLKGFLKSEYLTELTDKSAEYWLEYMLRKSRCIYCDFV